MAGPGVPEDSLTYKQRKAVFYLAAYNWPKKKVAVTSGVSLSKLNQWLELEEFNEAIEEKVAELSGIDKEFRLENAKKTLPFLYNELLRRLAIDDDELKELQTKDLVRLIGTMQKEIRLDTPGDVTGKVGHVDSSSPDLRDRYMSSTSAPRKKVVGFEEKRQEYASGKGKRKVRRKKG